MFGLHSFPLHFDPGNEFSLRNRCQRCILRRFVSRTLRPPPMNGLGKTVSPRRRGEPNAQGNELGGGALGVVVGRVVAGLQVPIPIPSEGQIPVLAPAAEQVVSDTVVEDRCGGTAGAEEIIAV